MKIQSILFAILLVTAIIIPAYAQIEIKNETDVKEILEDIAPIKIDPTLFLEKPTRSETSKTPIEFNDIVIEDFDNIGKNTGILKNEYRSETEYTKIFETVNGDPSDPTDDVYVSAVSLPAELISNGELKPYFKSEDETYITVASGQVTFSFNKNTCSAKIFNAGLSTEKPTISSSSYIIRQALNGTNDWIPIDEVNSAKCNYKIFEDGKSIEIRGIKTAQNIGELVIRYIKLYHEGLKPQLEFTNLNPLWTNHKFAFVGTDHVPETVTIDNKEENIKEVQEQKNRSLLELDSKLLSMEFGDMKYDALTGNDQIWSVNTVYENNLTKVVVDYSNQDGKIYLPNETLILDPLYTSATPSNDADIVDQDNNNVCNASPSSLSRTTGGTALDFGVYSSSNSFDCIRAYVEWSLPTKSLENADISKVEFAFQINTRGSGAGPYSDVRAMSAKPSTATDANVWADMGDGTQYINNDIDFDTVGTYLKDLGSTAVSDVETALSTHQDYFAVGLQHHDDVSTALNDNYGETLKSVEGSAPTRPTLILSYTYPVPTTPTTDVSVDGIVSSTNSTTSIGSILGAYYQSKNNTNTCQEPFNVTCSLISRFPFDGFATGLQDIAIENVTSESIGVALVFYDFDEASVENQATIENYNATVTFTDDFNTDEWTQVGTTVSIDEITDQVMDYDNDDDGAFDVEYYDVGLINNTNTVRWSFKPITISYSSNYSDLIFQLSDSTASDNVAQDSINCVYRLQTGNDKLFTADSDGTAPLASADTLVDWNPSTGTTYYMEMYRYAGDRYTCNVFSDISYSTLVLSVSGTTTSTNTGHRYMKISDSDYEGVSTGNNLVAEIDNATLYNNFAVLGRSADGTINGATFVNGLRGNATDFDGINDYVEIPYSTSMFQIGTPFTISTWVKFDAIPAGYNDIIGNANEVSCNSGGVHMWVDTTLNMILCDSSTKYTYVLGGTTVTANQWHHIVGTYDGGSNPQLEIYLDTVLEDNTETDGGGGDPTDLTGTINTYIGHASSGGFSDAKIDDTAIFFTAISSSQVQQLYNNGQGLNLLNGSSGDIFPYLTKQAGTTVYENTSLTTSFTDDGTSYADQTAYDSAWTSSDTAVIRGSPSNDRIDNSVNGDTTDDYISHDLGYELGNNFTMYFKTNISGVGGNPNYVFGISDQPYAIASASTVHDAIQVLINNISFNWFAVNYVDNGSYVSGGGYDAQSGVGLTGDKWWTLERSGTDIKASVYSDSARTSQVADFSDKSGVPSTVDGLRYIRFADFASAGTATMTIDDISVNATGDSYVAGSTEFDGATYYSTAPEMETYYDIFNYNGVGSVSFSYMSGEEDSAYDLIVGKGGVLSTSVAGWWIYNDGSNNMCFRITEATPNYIDICDLATTGFDKQWHQWVFTKGTGVTQASLKIYLDGVDVTGTNVSDTLVASTLNNNDIYIGAESDSTNFMDVGSGLDEVRIYSTELSSTDASNLDLYRLSGTSISFDDSQSTSIKSATVNLNGQSNWSSYADFGAISATCATSSSECGNAPYLNNTNGDINKFILHWTILNGTGVTGYRVEDSEDGNSWSSIATALANGTTSYTTSSSYGDNDARYFRVFGEPYDSTNSFIESRTIPDPEIQNYTYNYPDDPTITLVDLDGTTATNQNRFDIEWTDGTDPSGNYDATGGSPLLWYKIRAENIVNGSGWKDWVTNSTIPAVPRFFNMTDLPVNATFNIQVANGNGVDWSPWSPNATQSTTVIPTTAPILTAIPKATQIDLTWPMVTGTGGSDTKDFAVRYVNNTNGDTVFTTLVSNSTVNIGAGGLRYYNHTGLNVGVNQTYQVREGNIAGWSPYSNNSTAQVFEAISAIISMTESHSGDAIVVNGTWQMVTGIDGTVDIELKTIQLIDNGTVIQTRTLNEPATKGVTEDIDVFYMVELLPTVHDLKLRVNIQNSTGTYPFDSDVISVIPAFEAVYVNSIEGDIPLNYTHERTNAGQSIELTVNRADPPFQIECNFRSELFGDGDWVNLTDLGYYNITQSVETTRNVYIQCYNDQLLFTTVSFGETNATKSLVDFTSQLGTFFGVPLPFLFVIFLAAIFTGRSAPTGIIFLAGAIGVMGLMGYFPDPTTGNNMITATVWGMLILITGLGIFMGKRYF